MPKKFGMLFYLLGSRERAVRKVIKHSGVIGLYDEMKLIRLFIHYKNTIQASIAARANR